MATTKYWKVWLTPNLLTKDVDNDYIAEVSIPISREDIKDKYGIVSYKTNKLLES